MSEWDPTPLVIFKGFRLIGEIGVRVAVGRLARGSCVPAGAQRWKRPKRSGLATGNQFAASDDEDNGEDAFDECMIEAAAAKVRTRSAADDGGGD